MDIVDETKSPVTLEKRANADFPTGLVMDKWLSGSLTIASVSVASFDGDDELEITSVEVNTSSYTRPKPNQSESYAAGLVIKYNVAGGVAGTTYNVPFTYVRSDGATDEIVQPWVIK